jgi:ferric-dicitrate binding protein FerR (iron transport regulator)
LTVTDEPLSAVVTELGLRFGVEVTLAGSVDGSVRVSAYYPLLRGIDSVLGDIAMQQNLRTRRTADGWELF